MLDAVQVQRVIPDQQGGVAAQRQPAEGHGIQPRQGRRGDGQRHQIVRDEGVGGAASVEQQHAVNDQVAGQLYRILLLGQRPRALQAQAGKGAEQRGKPQGNAQRQPGQRQQVRQVGEPHRAGLRGQHQNADQRQAPEVLSAGGQQLRGCVHDFSKSAPRQSAASIPKPPLSGPPPRQAAATRRSRQNG